MSLAKKKRIRTEERILDVAETNFRARGFDDTRMGDIAEQAEVAPKTLFNYFTSKEQLVLALVVRWLERNADEIIEDSAPRSLDIHDVLPPHSERRHDLLDQERWLGALAATKTDVLVSYRWNLQSRTELLLANRQFRTEKIRAAQARGQVTTAIPAELISKIYEGIRDNLLGHWLMTPDGDIKELKVQMQQAMQVFLKGIAA
jgi:AcrR family transcriptional regulator